MGMAFIGALAILFGGSSGGGGNPLEGLITALCVVLYIGLLYAYWALSVIGFVWVFEQIGAGQWAIVSLILPIALPMLAASITKSTIGYRARRANQSAGHLLTGG